MIENNFFCTDNISAVIPVEIKIRVFKNLFETEFFGKDGQPIYVLEGKEPISRRYRNTEIYETFTDELYIELLSIDNEKQAENFVNSHPYYCMSFPTDIGNKHTNNVINKRDYIQLMLENINDFRTISALYTEVYLMLKDPDNTTLRNNTIHHLLSNSLLNTNSIDYEFIISFGSGSLSRGQKSILYEAIENLIRYIELRTSTIKITAQLKPVIEFCCSTLISAMYQKMIISAINSEEYRKCAKKTCSNYFKVESRSTRKFCDKHMEARRKKQKNYLEKQKLLLLD